jgi:5-formyltetrahydrofolate cyclo-ligase
MTEESVKAALRRTAETVRAKAHAELGGVAGEALARHGMAVLGERSFLSVSAYWPIRTEIDIRPLLSALVNNGRDAALPVVAGRGQPLQFRRWRPGVSLDRDAFGLAHPRPDAPIILPDVVLVPLLAFDRRHHRLGYGAGFYDRTLADLRHRKQVLAIGVAFAAQEVEEVPLDSWDEPLDLVLTERGVV